MIINFDFGAMISISNFMPRAGKILDKLAAPRPTTTDRDRHADRVPGSGPARTRPTTSRRRAATRSLVG